MTSVGITDSIHVINLELRNLRQIFVINPEQKSIKSARKVKRSTIYLRLLQKPHRANPRTCSRQSITRQQVITPWSRKEHVAASHQASSVKMPIDFTFWISALVLLGCASAARTRVVGNRIHQWKRSTVSQLANWSIVAATTQTRFGKR